MDHPKGKFFADVFPEENKRFGNVEYVDAVPEDSEASLLRMRKKMLSRDDLSEAVFIGGMEGILEEYALFAELHPEAKILAVPAPGGAARRGNWPNVWASSVKQIYRTWILRSFFTLN